MRPGLLVLVAVLCAAQAGAQTPMPAQPAKAPTIVPAQVAPKPLTTAPVPAAPGAMIEGANALYIVRYDHWTDADERGYGEFITAIGESGCHRVNDCLHIAQNPFRASDPPGVEFRFRLRRPALCAALLLCVEARSAVFLRERGRAARPHPRHPLHAQRQRSRRAQGRADAARSPATNCSTRSATPSRPPATASIPISTGLGRPTCTRPRSTPNRSAPARWSTIPTAMSRRSTRSSPTAASEYIDAHPDNSADPRLLRPALRARLARHGRGLQELAADETGRRHAARRWRLIGGRVVRRRRTRRSRIFPRAVLRHRRAPRRGRRLANGSFMLNGETSTTTTMCAPGSAGGKLRIRSGARKSPTWWIPTAPTCIIAPTPWRWRCRRACRTRRSPMRLPREHLRHRRRLGGLFHALARCAAQDRVQGIARRRAALRSTYVAGDTTRARLYRRTTSPGTCWHVYDRTACACKLTYQRSDGSPITLGYEEMRSAAVPACRSIPISAWSGAGARRTRPSSPPAATARRSGLVCRRSRHLRNQLDRTYDAEMDFTLEELRRQARQGRGAASRHRRARLSLERARRAA